MAGSQLVMWDTWIELPAPGSADTLRNKPVYGNHKQIILWSSVIFTIGNEAKHGKKRMQTGKES